MAEMLQPDVRPIKSPELAELMNARDGLVRDRTALKNREKNLTLPLLKRQAKALIKADAVLAGKREIIARIKGLGPITAAQLIATANALLKANRLWQESIA
jgi:transposase